MFYSWIEVFIDQESGVHYYIWSIGSKPGYDDIMGYVNVSDVNCAVSDPNSPLNLHEGHAYFINVRVKHFRMKFRRVYIMCYIFGTEYHSRLNLSFLGYFLFVCLHGRTQIVTSRFCTKSEL